MEAATADTEIRSRHACYSSAQTARHRSGHIYRKPGAPERRQVTETNY